MFPAILAKAVVGAIIGFAGSVISDIAIGQNIDWKGVAKTAAIEAVAGVVPTRILSSTISVALNVADYLWECEKKEEDVETEVVVWEVMATAASDVLGAGFECGAMAASKTMDKIVQGVYETGIDIATSSVGKEIKNGTQSTPEKKTVYDPLLGRMREITCY